LNEKNKNLIVRVASAVVLLPGVIFLLYKGGYWSAALIGAASAVCTGEYYVITQRRISAAGALGIAASLAIPWFPAWRPHQAGDLTVWTLEAFFILVWAHQLIRSPIQEAVSSAAHLVTGLVYAALGLAALSALRIRADGLNWVFVVLIVTWGNDTLAYFVGRALGKRKLYPEISPHKTWEGFAGGMIGSIAGMFISKETFFPELTIVDCLSVGILAGIVGPIGDLCESMLKRTFNVKDSGKIIPGHGGLLDRIDALLFNAPATFLYVHFLRGIV
jgi:phosphatidate cytidylyltransferase